MSARHTIGCMVVCALLATSTWAQTLTMDVTPGFDGLCPAEGCYPVTVTILGERANAPPVVAEVEVVANSWIGSSRARKLVTLSGGIVSQAVGFLLCSPEEPYEVLARLILRGRVMATSKPASVTAAQWFPLLVGLGSETSAVAHLPQRSLGVVSIDGRLVTAEQATNRYEPSPFSADTSTGARNRRLFIGRVRTSLPPDSMLAYRGVAAVSLDDRAWDTLTERQQNALKGYVLSGGLLVVHGVDLNRLQTLIPSGLLPVEPLGLMQVPAPTLAGWIPSLRGATSTVDVVRSRVLSGGRVLLSYRDIPLAVTMPKGQGQVVFLAFDPSQPPLANNDAAHSLWKNLLRLQIKRFVPPATIFPDKWISYWGASSLSTDYFAGMIEAMVEAVAANPVPLGWLIAYLGVYTLMLIPMNYLVLRKLDRLQWSWFTLPALALLTSAAGYAIATQVQTSSHQLRWWTALYTSSGSPQVAVESDWVLYSAHSQRYRLRARVDSTIIENSSRTLQAQHAMEISQEEPADIRDVLVPLWSARSFHLSGIAPLQGTVDVTAQRKGKTLLLNVRNSTPYSLKNLLVVSPSGVISVGDACPPGGQRNLSVAITERANVPALPLESRGYSTPLTLQQSTTKRKDWREQTMQSWLGMVWMRLISPVTLKVSSPGYPPVPYRSRPPVTAGHGDLSRAVLVGEIEGFPQPAEITPLSRDSIQQATMLAVAFEVQGGGR